MTRWKHFKQSPHRSNHHWNHSLFVKPKVIAQYVESAETPGTESTSSTCTPRGYPSSKHKYCWCNNHKDLFRTEDLLAAEVLWAVKTVVSHYSTSCSANTGNLFQRMFPDSKIAQNFSCWKNKVLLFNQFWIGTILSWHFDVQAEAE